MDYSDSFALHSAGIYAARFGHLEVWPLTDLIRRTSGRDELDLPMLREQFVHILRTKLLTRQLQ